MNMIKKNILFSLLLFTFFSCPDDDDPKRIPYHRIEFFSEGEVINVQTVLEGEQITKPETFQSGCYLSFDSWYTDTNFNNLYNFDDRVMEEFNLYAKWEGPRNEPIEIEGAYHICYWKHLQWIAGGETNAEGRGKRLSSSYALKKDITFPEPGQDDFPEYGFVPIGYDTGTSEFSFEGTPFTGIFNGNGYTINNFFIDATHSSWTTPDGVFSSQTLDDDYIGLFGRISGTATVSDLTIVLHPKDASISNSINTGGKYVGGLVGELLEGTVSKVSVKEGRIQGQNNVGGLVGWNQSTINESHTTGEVSGSGGNVGGLVGHNENLVEGYATGSVSGTGNNVGGLVGYNYNQNLANNVIGVVIGYATGSVSGAGNDVGGLVGQNRNSKVDGYATGSVEGNNNVGGLVGQGSIDPEKSGFILGFATGSVSGRAGHGNNIGGLMGWNYRNNVSGYATGTVSGTTSVGGLVGKNEGNLIGYSTGAVSGTTSVGGLVGKNFSTVTGYWDMDSSEYTSSDGGIGVSSTKNIVFTGGGYSDSSDDKTIFDNSVFLLKFEPSGVNKTWPKLNEDFLYDELQPTVSDIDGNGSIDVVFP